jgi:hypothetical protein
MFLLTDKSEKVPMQQATIDAITARKCMTLTYNGFTRLIEPHAYSRTREGQEIVWAWQVRGSSVSHERTRGKPLRTDELKFVHQLTEPSMAPRPGYMGETR